MTDLAIIIENLSKEYLLDDKFKQTVREKIAFKKGSTKRILALSNISLTINKGEVVGIIGDNGSGKSTLLKIISGITKPSRGSVSIEGNVASILEVGTGFHPELSGRENIYFSASVLGMPIKETEKLEKEIIQFSELQDFIDMQVKYYSSGMFMRLAFSVIAHIQADILLLDEVFSVGDAEFKRKCEKKLVSLKGSGKTILLVSHEISSVMKMCEKFVWLDGGELKKHGQDLSIINNYLAHGNSDEVIDQAYQEKNDKLSNESSDEIVSLSNKEKNNTPDDLSSLLEETAQSPSGEKDVLTIEIEEPQEESAFKGDDLKLQKEVSILPYTISKSKNKIIISDLNSEDLGDKIVLEVCTESGLDSTIYPEDNILIKCSYEKKNNKSILPVFGISYQLSAFSLICNPRYNQENLKISELVKTTGLVSTECCIPNNLLNNGLFGVSLFFLDEERNEYFFIENLTTFTVKYKPSFAALFADDGKAVSALKPKFVWTVNIEKNHE